MILLSWVNNNGKLSSNNLFVLFLCKWIIQFVTDISISCFASHHNAGVIVSCQIELIIVLLTRPFSNNIRKNSMAPFSPADAAIVQCLTARSISPDFTSIQARLYRATSCPAIATASRWNLAFFKSPPLIINASQVIMSHTISEIC